MASFRSYLDRLNRLFSFRFLRNLKTQSQPQQPGLPEHRFFFKPLNLVLLSLILLIFSVIWFSNLEYRKLIRPDEGRYAEISREMAVSDNWITPRLNDLKYFEKPPLQYWATATAFTLFGEHHWAARLWSALTGFLGLLVVFFTGKKLFSFTAGFYAALVLASSLLYVAIGHLNTLDMGLTFFINLGICAFLIAQHKTPSSMQPSLYQQWGGQLHQPTQSNAASHEALLPLQTKIWMLIAWASLALAVLSKGLIGIILPSATLIIYSLIERDISVWKRLYIVPGLSLFFLISAPWFIAVSIANPEFFQFFFIHEHFERFLTQTHRRYEPAWYFIPILFFGTLPWLVTMVDALLFSWKKKQGNNEPTNNESFPTPFEKKNPSFNPKRFLLIWIIFLFVFFSISQSKLPSYILPLFPALALLIGSRLYEASARVLFWHMLPTALLAFGFGLFAFFGIEHVIKDAPPTAYEEYVPWLYTIAFSAFLSLSLCLFLAWKGKKSISIVLIALTGLLSSQLMLMGHETLSKTYSGFHLAEEIKPFVKPNVPFYSVGLYDQTLPFYLKRPLTLVAYQDEMALGIEQEPYKYIPNFDEFEQTWLDNCYGLAIMAPGTHHYFSSKGLPMKMIAKNERYVVTEKP